MKSLNRFGQLPVYAVEPLLPLLSEAFQVPLQFRIEL
eukprot:CAMPEP_0180678902 /NCGR_PEP_ID=MMETSP1037_2-20121125/68633_1 /TAXON_ID=632150 /ORGANISM="Azadinium spinosum, Strain 3D9" /LENGTH=36 /DNA_ID= /DNA_START= /DNA_END= /DNA_ORIENTATION=